MARDPRELRGGWAAFQRHWYGVPAPDLAPFVSGYWHAEWDLRGQEPYRQKVLPYPTVHLTFLNGIATVRGPERRHIVRVLAGRGEIFGVTFRPGHFRSFLGAPVSTITGRAVPAAELFGPGVPRVTREKSGEIEEFLRARLPARDPLAETAAAIVAQIQDDQQLNRVDALAARAGLGVRRLQRLFAEYVGVGPKWVIRRYRLHEVGGRLASGVDIDWVRLAGELGYADQAHFVRDFTAMVGESPTRYAARYPQARG